MKTKKIGYDRIDNACHQFLCLIAESDLDWDMESIGEVRDAVESALKVHGIELELTDDSICGSTPEGASGMK
jgi:hypothetical protein